MEEHVRKISFARQLRRNQTDVEQLLWRQLRGRRFNGIKFRRQHPVGPYIVDFISLKKRLIIELDGGHHNSAEGKKKDKERLTWLEENNYNILRFWNNEVINDLDSVLSVIHNTLTLPSPKKPHPISLSSQERGQGKRAEVGEG